MAQEKNAILIVDDEKMNLRVLVSILHPDYTVYTAKDGATAIEMAVEFMPDLILLDIVMPGMDGYEVLTVLKNNSKTKNIPIVFITGLGSHEAEEKGLALDAADYIVKPFSAAIVKLRVRNQIQIVNQIRTIERLSMVDKLTDIPNRRSFDQQLAAEWGRALRDNTPVSLLIADVDLFKGYNDTYGHIQGDQALKTVAKCLQGKLRRSSDLVARFGGEEFAVLLPNTDVEGAYEIAEQMRRDVEEAVILREDGSITKVTVSIGVHAQFLDKDITVSEFISKADKALYAAKKTGRNRVCRYEGS